MESIGTLLVGLVIIFIVLYLIRQIVLWYFKIDIVVKQNEEIIRLLKRIADK